MEPAVGIEAEATAASDAPRTAQMFTNTSRLDFYGSQFTNVLGDLNVTYNRERPRAVQGPRPQPAIHVSTSERIYSDSESYCNQLLRRGRGFPLYDPAPRGNLPTEYGRRGVNIGDVGRVTPEGIFDFFFNIYLPADHPINDNDVPENFAPLAPYDSKNVLPTEYLPGQHVSTAAVHRVDLGLSEGDDGEFVFDCLGPQGAVLALPLGSHIERLENFGDMLQYTRQNAEDWYRYVNGARGRQLSNGSLYLITGWEKARAWGIAAFQDIHPTRYPFRISFGPTFINSGFASQKSYRWTTIGATRTKSSGPLAMGQQPLNQTLFIHGFSISLGTTIWSRLFKTVEVAPIVDSQLGQSGKEYIPYGAQGFGNSWGFGSFWGGGGAGGHDAGVTLSHISPTQALFHPSQVMNPYLHRIFPDAAVVMTHDDDWRELLHGGYIPSDSSDREALQLLRRACFGLNVREEDGLAVFNISGEILTPFDSPPELTLRDLDPWGRTRDFGRPPVSLACRSSASTPDLRTLELMQLSARRQRLPDYARWLPSLSGPVPGSLRKHRKIAAMADGERPAGRRRRRRDSPPETEGQNPTDQLVFGEPQPGDAGMNNNLWMAPMAPDFSLFRTPQQDWRDGLAMASTALSRASASGISYNPLATNPFVPAPPLDEAWEQFTAYSVEIEDNSATEIVPPANENDQNPTDSASPDTLPALGAPHPDKDELDESAPEEDSN